MGTPRVMFDADELVVSKLGKDATSPTLPETDKIFDSKWLFGLQVLGSGVWSLPYGTTSGTFPMPDFGFIPAMMFRTKMRPHYGESAGQYVYRERTERPNLSVFTGDPISLQGYFASNTSVVIAHSDSYSAVDIHWLALAI